MTTKCTNPFLEEDGYCNKCSSYHFRTNGRGDVVSKKKSTPTRKSRKQKLLLEKERSIQDTINSTPHYKAAVEMVELLNEVYEVDVKIKFKNMKSYCYYKNATNTIWMGYQVLDWMAENGYQEYRSLEWMLPNEALKGADAGKWIAMHEFAHHLQYEEQGGHIRGSVHNDCFIKHYREIIELVQ